MLIETKWVAALALMSMLLTACTLTPNRAPVEERNVASKSAPVAMAAASAASAPAAPASAASAADPVKALPGAENAGKPGYYTVKPGDTLIRIGLDNGQNWKDLIKWNGLDNPNIIEVGQVIRVVQPGLDPNAASSKPVTAVKVESKTLDAKPASGATSGVSSPPVSGTSTASPAQKDGEDDVNWIWPANGSVITPFSEGKAAGLAIGGKAGDPVLAAADGRVVYAGSGLRGYGNLIILKHNNTYLTAYAHNQTLLVKEDQSVKRGQKIAEMGSTDSDSVNLHFEIRKLGKPIDPAKLLPPR
jgi:lipoprotein NlpD